ncbi:MAG: hypothetical protein PHE61_08620 [Candidatus Omnitrophica bacterium]|nr:hypothetical protein [Candidatus Omnitrophota bacterium]
MLRTDSRWRLHARNIIREVAEQNKTVSLAEVRKLISQAYPFGERKYHPYKCWLREVDLFFKQKDALEKWNQESKLF